MPKPKKPEELAPIEKLPKELVDNINRFIPPEPAKTPRQGSIAAVRGLFSKKIDPEVRGLAALASASSDTNRLFGPFAQAKKLLSKIFWGKEEDAATIVTKNPRILFERETYRMPLLNQDGTPSAESEQIYHDVNPLELLFYTDDFKMWDKIFPLILENQTMEEKDKNEMLEKIHATMQKVKRGGPDLVKINRDPTRLTWEQLKHFNAGNDEKGKPIIYDLLKNPDGIICWPQPNGTIRYFYAHPEKPNPDGTIVDELQENIRTDEDDFAFRELQTSINNDMVMNSSKRTSDDEHALIARIFGKKLERNGIHYEHRILKTREDNTQYYQSIHYHDTHDGCNRLINAYRKYLELYDAHVLGTSWDTVDAAWVKVVGLAQRYSMPNILQRFCEKDKPFYPLPDTQELKTRPLVRTEESNEFINYTKAGAPLENLYPLIAHSICGLGFIFGLYKGLRAGGVRAAGRGRWPASGDLAAIRQIREVTTTRFNELGQELYQRLQAGPAARVSLV